MVEAGLRFLKTATNSVAVIALPPVIVLSSLLLGAGSTVEG
jgi:hypothetical protein